MALQSLQRSPFRVVDEINQGMDQRNERLVHKRMVQIATGHDEMRFAVRAAPPITNGHSGGARAGDGHAGSDVEDQDEDEEEDIYGDGGGNGKIGNGLTGNRETALVLRNNGGTNGVNTNNELGANGEAPGSGSQYFLLTPKLLHGLHYERGMRVMCIASGEYMPEGEARIDFEACVRRKRELNAAAASARDGG